MSETYISPLLQRQIAWIRWRDAMATKEQVDMDELLDLLEERFQIIRLAGQNIAADIETWVMLWDGDKLNFRRTLVQLAAL
jgi:hypothetical protein